MKRNEAKNNNAKDEAQSPTKATGNDPVEVASSSSSHADASDEETD